MVVEEKKPVEKKINHNLLTLLVAAKIEKINIKVYTTDSLEANVINF